MSQITFIFTGGTIDSRYDPEKCTPIPHQQSILPLYIEKRLYLDSGIDFKYIQLCAKDSRDLLDSDLEELVRLLQEDPNERCIITHGTFTLFKTARFLQNRLPKLEKKIILTGAMIPIDGFYHSDGPFNLGYSLGVIERVDNGIWVCIRGKCYPPFADVSLHG